MLTKLSNFEKNLDKPINRELINRSTINAWMDSVCVSVI